MSDSWDKPFKRIGTQPAWTNQTEDPGIFRDKRGNFHILGAQIHTDIDKLGITMRFRGPLKDLPVYGRV